MVISLIGYRGSGKSTVGQQLAARLNWEFVDADIEIERHAGKSIASIFAGSGEPEFRRIESELIAQFLQQDQLVLATGGGAILDANTRSAMQLAGPVVWLQADSAALFARIQSDETTGQRRPSLTDSNPRAEIDELLARRTPLYREAATLTVVTDDRTVTALVDEIVAALPNTSSDR
ncbi:MAG: shikimate kinase [Planctomycetaceae bacterium]